MKWKTWILAFALVCFAASLFAENYGKEKLESLNTTGLVKLNGTEILDTLHITGSLISRDAQIGLLDIIGEANLTETVVSKGGCVMGLMQATRSIFKESITILSQRAVFTASDLEGITVKQDSAYKGKQVIELRQGTIVKGPIKFESGKGEVILFSPSQILGGVSGGKVVKK